MHRLSKARLLVQKIRAENALCQLKRAITSAKPWNAGTPFRLPKAAAAWALL
jgi:hypothetical protein